MKNIFLVILSIVGIVWAFVQYFAGLPFDATLTAGLSIALISRIEEEK